MATYREFCWYCKRLISETEIYTNSFIMPQTVHCICDNCRSVFELDQANKEDKLWPQDGK